MCDPPRIYPSIPKRTPLFNKFICATLPESTPPSQNLPSFQQLQYYATLPESTPPSQNIPPPLFFNNFMRYSQNLPPPKIHPPFQQLYSTLPESTPPSQNIPPPPLSTNKCDTPRIYPPPPPPIIYPPFQQIYMCDSPKIYTSLPECTPLLNNYYIMRRSRNLPLPLRIYPLSATICDTSKI